MYLPSALIAGAKVAPLAGCPLAFTATMATTPTVCPCGAADTTKVAAPDAPPPGAGVVTVTWADPTDATSVAEIAAVSRVALT
jgi:hypothetical protein